jgi:hypothetical protein
MRKKMIAATPGKQTVCSAEMRVLLSVVRVRLLFFQLLSELWSLESAEMSDVFPI